VGLPVGPDKKVAVSFLDLLRPYPLVVGLFVVAIFAMHGSIYLYLKTEGELQRRIHDWIWHTFGIFLVVYVLTTIFTLVHVPKAIENFRAYPWAWGIVVLNVLAIANIPRAVFLNQPFYAFVSSACTIAAFNFLFGFALFPHLLTSNLGHAWSLTIYNAASSPKTLKIMLLMAGLGMPFVLAYTTLVYWVFRGKVQLGKLSY